MHKDRHIDCYFIQWIIQCIILLLTLMLTLYAVSPVWVSSKWFAYFRSFHILWVVLFFLTHVASGSPCIIHLYIQQLLQRDAIHLTHLWQAVICVSHTQMALSWIQLSTSLESQVLPAWLPNAVIYITGSLMYLITFTCLFTN